MRPSVAKLLSDLEDVLPGLDLSQYTSTLKQIGMTTVDDILGVGKDFLVDVIGLPRHAVDLVQDHAQALSLFADEHSVSRF
jgi:hypothetical protein